MTDDFEVRRKALASALLDDMERLRLQLFAPVTERKAMAVSDGKDCGSHIEVVDIELDEPTFAAKRLIVASIAEAVTKVAQLIGSEPANDGDANPAPDWSAPLALVGDAPVRDAAESGSVDARPRGRGRGKAAGKAVDAVAAARG